MKRFYEWICKDENFWKETIKNIRRISAPQIVLFHGLRNTWGLGVSRTSDFTCNRGLLCGLCSELSGEDRPG